MTHTTNSRLAGLMFLFYIVTGIANMVLFGQATRGSGTAEKLASMAQHATTVRLTVLLTLLTFVIAVVLAAALYALTREQDRDVALLALCFRVTEGVIAAVSSVRTMGLLSIATASAAVNATDTAAANSLAGMLLIQGGWTGTIAAICFAVGSTLYSYLFLRARSIPVPLAWLGVLASVILVLTLPLQLVGLLPGPVTWYVWMPMLVFEVVFALYLLIKGVETRSKRISREVLDVAE
jgi:Domain of unknown function (DUF4386)